MRKPLNAGTAEMSPLSGILGLLDRLNAYRRKRRLAVRDEKLSGMPSGRVYCSVSRRSVRSRPQNLNYDQHIRELLPSGLNGQSWSNLRANDIVVEQDAVWLYGTVRDEGEKRTI